MGDITAISAEVVRWGLFFTALLLAVGIGAGWLEAGLGVGLNIPALQVSPRLRIPVLLLCLLVAAFAVPISNSVVRILFGR